MRIIINLQRVDDDRKELAAICAARSALLQQKNPDWCDGAIVKYSGGIVCSTCKTKTGFSVFVWDESGND